ncbi:MAG: FAD-dependent oxidoreductase [Planctomycetota bacterium]
MVDAFDCIVLGGGMRGLVAALTRLRARPADSLRIVEAAPRPGGAVATQRSNGFVCELGPIGFGRAELAAMTPLLAPPPRVLEPQPAAARGVVLGLAGPREIELAELPVSFPSGAEELPQACRRQLGERLLLGRAVVGVRPEPDGFAVTLGGEVTTELRAPELVVALPMRAAATLFGGLDPALADVGARLAATPAAFVFLGGLAARLPELRGYGWLPEVEVGGTVAEAIVCSEVFAGRALPGRVLVRCEVVGEPAGLPDGELVAAAVAELRRWTGCAGDFGFGKVHRFAVEDRDAAWAECRARLLGFAARGARVVLAPDVLR